MADVCPADVIVLHLCTTAAANVQYVTVVSLSECCRYLQVAHVRHCESGHVFSETSKGCDLAAKPTADGSVDRSTLDCEAKPLECFCLDREPGAHANPHGPNTSYVICALQVHCLDPPRFALFMLATKAA